MNDDRLGPYRLLRRLGEGGMGVVHLATDPQGRQVAVKVLRSEVAGDEVARRRLAREVETMRRVRSSYIAEVLDADVTGHRPYIVTRYVPGRPLDEIVKNDGPLDLPALLKIGYGVAAALAAVHSVGVIHRDLKPGNVLILDGEPVLIDFGIAQAVDATRLTQTGMFIGTPGYLAPEIIEGQEAGPEVDIHAWAGTLLYAGTGQPPFGKGTLEMVFYNITAGKADVSAAPKAIQPLLKAAFQRNPAKRPKAAELAEQTARMMPKPAGGAPDQISTVPRPDGPPQTGEHLPPRDPSLTPPFADRPLHGTGHQDKPAAPPYGTGPQGVPAGPPYGTGPQGVPTGPPYGTGPQDARPYGNDVAAHGQERRPQDRQDVPVAGDRQPWEAATPPMTPRHLVDGRPPPVPPQGTDQQYVSLLPGQGDPWPTRRVSPEELRQMQREAGRQSLPWSQAPAAQPSEGEVPTRRVRPEAPDYGRGAPVPPPPYIPAQGQFPPEPQTRREPFIPGAIPGQPLKQSAAYAVAGAMLLVIMIVLAALAPVLVAVVAVPIVVLLRAADLAQPSLTVRRPSSAAALDVIRVFAFPQALAKSVGITLALVLYALILGLPVTLLLTVVVKMDPNNALAWGAAVALWTVCAGPGVEGPGRQMRRTLSSLVPSRTAAMVMAGVLAAGAALSLILAYGTYGNDAREAIWGPVDVESAVTLLDKLKGDDDG
ncbi:serine/threonine-protein kinase [Nonomuraea sp. SBT364]|uniref:serine/threonine-protein kinase n=1 Tax=Nonomuraea sp. SBT364 TaxID=1580530 RepID=UPI00069E7C76|nr:serine/threonine-protein kinase [Nonomuraea sp. SBT364]